MISHPSYTSEEAIRRETFLALMWALSYPGRIYDLPGGGFPTGDSVFNLIADTLLDLETSYYTPDYTPDVNLAIHLARTGARALPVERASYHFYPILAAEHLSTLYHADAGTLLYPDRGATLFIGCQFKRETMLTLSGPGITPGNPLKLGAAGIPEDFWAKRATHRYPLGWDIYLVAGTQIVGLPRTTKISLEA